MVGRCNYGLGILVQEVMSNVHSQVGSVVSVPAAVATVSMETVGGVLRGESVCAIEPVISLAGPVDLSAFDTPQSLEVSR